MRKHRLSGVVIAVLIGLGVFAHWPDTAHRTPGTDRAGIQLASADLPAGRTAARRPHHGRPLATDRRGAAPCSICVAGRAVASLSSPFGTPALVWDVRVAELTQRAEGGRLRAAMAQRQAEAKAYLDARRGRPEPAGPGGRRPVVGPRHRRPSRRRRRRRGPTRWSRSGSASRAATTATTPATATTAPTNSPSGTWRSLGFGGLPVAGAAGRAGPGGPGAAGPTGVGPVALVRARLGLSDDRSPDGLTRRRRGDWRRHACDPIGVPGPSGQRARRARRASRRRPGRPGGGCWPGSGRRPRRRRRSGGWSPDRRPRRRIRRPGGAPRVPSR